MSAPVPGGIPPASITALLRIEGLAALVAAVVAYQYLGANWWLFAALLLVPDLSMLGALGGKKIGARTYNLAHTYTLPAIVGVAGWTSGIAWLVPVALIWVAHIGMDRALGYGLKYDSFHLTHLGVIGKARHRSDALADAR